MKSLLDQSQDNITQAMEALKRAQTATELNERLRCLQCAKGMVGEAWRLIVEWRGGK
jgi:cytochrome c-type biogenesis protein CcmH/NrfF